MGLFWIRIQTNVFYHLIWLFLASLLVRGVVCYIVVSADVTLLYDESEYFNRAVGWQQVITSLWWFEQPSAVALEQAYGAGHWPPLHSLLLGLSFAAADAGIGLARYAIVFVSALTTLLVYCLALKLVTKQVAMVAAVVHIFYPTFIAYSHYLWSETSYTFWLMAAVLAALSAHNTTVQRKALFCSIIAGLAAGLAALTRAAGFPLILLLPLWFMCCSAASRRMLMASYALLTALLIIAPWQWILWTQEGRFVPLSTLGSYNLALGNNPWVPEGYGSAWGHNDHKQRLHKALAERAEHDFISPELAAYHLAWQEIRDKPVAFISRSVQRLQMFWAVDSFPLRHFFHVVYPPVPVWLAGFLIPLTVVCYLLLLGFIGWGFFARQKDSAATYLIIAAVAVAMAPSVLTIGMSRLHFPPLVLLLPFAAYGVIQLGQKIRPYYFKSALIISLLIWIMVVATLPRVITPHLKPSSYYATIIGLADRVLGIQSRYSDRILLRVLEPEKITSLDVYVISSRSRLHNNTRSISWHSRMPGSVLTVDIFSRQTVKPIQLSIKIATSATTVLLQPVHREAWQTWLPTNIPGVEYQWLGGVP